LRVAVSGSHGVGKSTLIAAFLNRHPEYAHEPEAFEVLGDDIDLTESGAPAPDGLRSLLEYTVYVLQGRAAQTDVVFERSPIDYLAYAAASGSAWPQGEKRRFLAEHSPVVRTSIRDLDLVAYLPLSATSPARRRGEDLRFRRRVDHCLRRALLDDVYELRAADKPPRVVELPGASDRQLAALTRLLEATDL
jgi:MoxR-like ATPase